MPPKPCNLLQLTGVCFTWFFHFSSTLMFHVRSGGKSNGAGEVYMVFCLI
jgi:hypothetical protein